MPTDIHFLTKSNVGLTGDVILATRVCELGRYHLGSLQ